MSEQTQPKRHRMIQLINVGRIGGTAACAYSVCRALPNLDHHIAIMGSCVPEQLMVMFDGIAKTYDVNVNTFPQPIRATADDFVIAHNTHAGSHDQLATAIVGRSRRVLYYQHSVGSTPIKETKKRVFASQWLAGRCGANKGDVLYQGVPSHYKPDNFKGEEIIVGRFAMPELKKWAPDTHLIYRDIAAMSDTIRFEVVGAPDTIKERLSSLLGDRIVFYDASWNARDLMSRWSFIMHYNPRLPESFGRVVVEGMRAGAIPIVDDLGAYEETVPEMVPPIGYRCSDITEFAQRIHEISQSPDYMRRMRRRAMDRANELYSHKAFASRLIEAFKRIGD